MKQTIHDVTGGNPRSLLVPSIASLLDGLCKVVPAAAVLDLIEKIFRHFRTGEVLDTSRMWIVSLILVVWLAVQYMAYSWSYDTTYEVSYESSARGRTMLAERLRRLSLGFLGSRDPGDLTTMMLGDYALVEQAISHFIPQLISGVALPLLAFVCLTVIRVLSAAMRAGCRRGLTV